MTESLNTRRDFVKKAAYAAPAILTLAAVSSYAKFGSDKADLAGSGGSGSSYRQALRARGSLMTIQTVSESSGPCLRTFNVVTIVIMRSFQRAVLPIAFGVLFAADASYTGIDHRVTVDDSGIWSRNV